jgi:hypothetical protein
MFNESGRVVIPDTLSVYYKGNGISAEQIRAIRDLPPGLRMIAGYDMARPGLGAKHYWLCEQHPSPHHQSIPNCARGERVGVTLQFPQCWDGRRDSPNHRSHMAYFVRDGHTGRLSCPSSHPTILPEFTLTVWWTSDGNASRWYLSSDRMAGMTHANGSTFHSDWFGAWDPTIQRRWRRECVNSMRNCVFGQLGDGSRLVGGYSYSGPKVVNVPRRPG